MNATEPTERADLSDIEPLLFDMRSAVAMLGHMASSDEEIDGDQIHYIEAQLIGLHRRLKETWQKAWDEWRAEHQANRAELAEAKATAKEAQKEAAPGSVAEIKQIRAFLDIARTTHRVSLDHCSEVGRELDKLLAERGEAQA